MRTLLVLAAIAGCVDYDPDTGPLNPGVSLDGGSPVSPNCVIEDSDPSVIVSLARDVRPMFQRTPGGCMSCHGNGRAYSAFDMSSYTSLRRGGLVSGTRIIIDGDPCGSLLPAKLSPTAPFGSRMPFSGPPFFTTADLQVIRDWIAEGANNN